MIKEETTAIVFKNMQLNEAADMYTAKNEHEILKPLNQWHLYSRILA